MRSSDWSSDVCSSDLLDAEFNDEPHVRGTCSMARAQNPNSADSQFFICFDDARFLDGQYTVWGAVTEGMEHVDAIKRGSQSQNGTVKDHDKIVSIRSEEHTSELQSLMRRSYAVLCLKKKKKTS